MLQLITNANGLMPELALNWHVAGAEQSAASTLPILNLTKELLVKMVSPLSPLATVITNPRARDANDGRVIEVASGGVGGTRAGIVKGRLSTCCRNSAMILGVAAVSLLTACGERGSSQSASGTAAGAAATPTAQCFIATGSLSANDAELFAATAAGDLGRIEQAIAAGGNVNDRDALKRTPLFAAAFCNRSEAAGLLVDQGADVNARDSVGMAPLHAAVVVGWEAASKALIAKGADINLRNEAGHTPLHLAAATNQSALVALLLERGADANARDTHGANAASLATENGHVEAAALLKKSPAKP
jgi:hypothetical protein